MLDNRLEQSRSEPRLLYARGCEVVVRVTMRMVVRMVERALGIYPRQSTFVALFLRLFTSSREEKGAVLVSLKTDGFLCTSPRGNVCILCEISGLSSSLQKDEKLSDDNQTCFIFCDFCWSCFETMFSDERRIIKILYISHGKEKRTVIIIILI